MTRAMFQEGRMTGEPARLQRRRRIPERHNEQPQSIKSKGHVHSFDDGSRTFYLVGGHEGSTIMIARW